MVCKRCDAEFTEGHKNCPRCGQAQFPYSFTTEAQQKHRDRYRGNKRRIPRATMMSIISIAFAVVVVFVLVPTMRSMLEAQRIEEIVACYDDIQENYRDHGDPARRERVDVLLTKINHFEGSFPNSKELGRFKDIREELTDADTGLDLSAKSMYMEVESVEIRRGINDNWNVTMRFSNRTNETVDHFYFRFMAYDAEGLPIEAEGKILATDRVARDEDVSQKVWYNVWQSADLAGVELIEAVIQYRDDKVKTLPAEYIANPTRFTP